MCVILALFTIPGIGCGAPSPEATVRAYLKAMESRDADAMVSFEVDASRKTDYISWFSHDESGYTMTDVRTGLESQGETTASILAYYEFKWDGGGIVITIGNLTNGERYLLEKIDGKWLISDVEG